ncbi:hypothetical protein ALNOE001_00650 [Candidatus Methanobinarius endosymbioticus]|uniref:Right handed beta helix domain-containing protein n=1 Tax=Candidatus Methanobinarius endosymbioticus TaxID=2006182 RepID=A0A366MED8_9EURY|nr:hypothetical protein ALNOE001_00650 [Candidatus Methanobinarius endosymbioticus]
MKGSALDTHWGNTTMIGCIFRANFALTTAGAVNFRTNTIGHQLLNCIFENNYAPTGGAVRVSSETIIIDGCVFISNYANDTHGSIVSWIF